MDSLKEELPRKLLLLSEIALGTLRKEDPITLFQTLTKESRWVICDPKQKGCGLLHQRRKEKSGIGLAGGTNGGGGRQSFVCSKGPLYYDPRRHLA